MRTLSTELFHCSLIRGAALERDDAGDVRLVSSGFDLLLLTFGDRPAPTSDMPIHVELALELATPLEGATPGPLPWSAARIDIGRPVRAFVAEVAHGELTVVAMHRHADLHIDLELASPRVDTEGWERARVVGPLTLRNVRWAAKLDAVRDRPAVVTILKELVSELRPHLEVHEGTRLDALALSSLELYRLAFEAEDILGVELDGLDGGPITTLVELAEHLVRERA